MDERIDKYFKQELPAEERIALLKEAASDEALKKQFAEEQNLHALLNLGRQLEDRALGKEQYDRFVRKERQARRLQLFRRWTGYAAAVLLLIGATNWATWQIARTGEKQAAPIAMQTLTTPAGQRAQLLLPDGTEVWLNAKSRLTYPANFSEERREVRLEGEAFFKVAKEEKRPFIVQANEVRMKVLGTQFNVYNYPETGFVQTALLEGSVRVFLNGHEKEGITLQPDQQVTATGNKLLVHPIRKKNHFLWKEGIYAFDKEPLIDIMKKLELYYDVHIIVKDTTRFNETYTGKFRQRDSLDDIFRILQQIRPFNVHKDMENNTITLS